jgi:hypothetical protein
MSPETRRSGQYDSAVQAAVRLTVVMKSLRATSLACVVVCCSACGGGGAAGPSVSREEAKALGGKFVSAFFNSPSENETLRKMRALGGAGLAESVQTEYPDVVEKSHLKVVAGPRVGCDEGLSGFPRGKWCVQYFVVGGIEKDPVNVGIGWFHHGVVYVLISAHAPATVENWSFGGGFSGCKIGGNCAARIARQIQKGRAFDLKPD